MRNIKTDLMPGLSLIIITFNSDNFIKSCLDSVFSQSYKYFEVIVVDNGSKDDTVNLIRNNYPQATLIENKQNLGACKGRNQGIYASRSKWVLCLDCDIILESGFLNKIMNFASLTESDIGMLQPKVLKYDKKKVYSCGIYLSKIRRFYDIGKDDYDNGRFDNSRHIFGVCSAAALYRKDMLEEIKDSHGYFDERFFFLVEDVDLSWRAQKRGWKASFFPEAICYHLGNSSGFSKKIRQYLCFRNRLLLILKNDTLASKIKLIPVFLMYDLPRLAFVLFNYPGLNLKRQLSGL
jgi:GT2 family glycosyltransferase